MDVVTLSLAKAYTNRSILGIDGALAGKNCKIKSITKQNGISKITFEWTADDGTSKTNILQVSDGYTPQKDVDYKDGENGVSISNVEIDETTKHLIVHYSDGGQDDLGIIPTHIDISQEDGNALVKKTDGLYVKATSDIKISNQPNNAIVQNQDGIFVDSTSMGGNINISQEDGNALIEKEDGFYVGVGAVEVSQELDNAIKNKEDGLYVKEIDGDDYVTKQQDASDKGKVLYVDDNGLVNNGTINVRNVYPKWNNDSQDDEGEFSVGTFNMDEYAKLSEVVSKEYDKSLISSSLLAQITDNKNHIGDMTKLSINNVSDLVTAVNALYNNFMASLVYSEKKMVITYRNGYTVDIDVSSVITDTTIEEFKDVNIDKDNINDGDLLVWNTTTNKWINKPNNHATVLQDAKDYADEAIANAQESNAISCDEKPTYDSATDTVTYTQNGETKTEENTVSWFYYKVDSNTCQTRWINGVEFTLDVGAVKLDNYINKTTDVVSIFAENPNDLNKIPDLNYMNGLRSVLITAMGNKVNTSDIVDNLVSDSSDLPLSAKQGKYLYDNKLDKTVVTTTLGINVDGDNQSEEEGITTQDLDLNRLDKIPTVRALMEIHTIMNTNLDKKFNSTTDVENVGKGVLVDELGNLVFGDVSTTVMTEITQAEYDLLSSEEKANKLWYIKDAEEPTVNQMVIDDTAVSGSKAYSSRKVQTELNKKAVINDASSSTTTVYSSNKVDSLVNDKLVEEKGLELFGWIAPKINNVADYIDADGVYHKKIGRVDLGTITWTYNTTYSIFRGTQIDCETNKSNLLCDKYTIQNAGSSVVSTDNSIAYSTWFESRGNILVHDSAYTDATTFKTAMQSIYLYYELATEETKSIYSNDKISELNNNSIDLKMLGWTVPNEMKIKNYVDGNGIFHQRVGRVDLGSLNWGMSGSGNRFNAIINIPSETLNLYTIIYTATNSWENLSSIDKTIFTTENSLYIHDSSYSDTTAFKRAMSSVYLYYELNAEITKKVDGNEKLITEINSLKTKIKTLDYYKSSTETDFVKELNAIARVMDIGEVRFFRTNGAVVIKSVSFSYPSGYLHKWAGDRVQVFAQSISGDYTLYGDIRPSSDESNIPYMFYKSANTLLVNKQ